MDKALRNKVAIVGVGYTPVVRETERSLGSFAINAALNAIKGDGLTVKDIDGYVGIPGAPNASAMQLNGVDEVSMGYMLGNFLRRLVFHLAEVAVPREVFAALLERIGRLALAPG